MPYLFGLHRKVYPQIQSPEHPESAKTVVQRRQAIAQAWYHPRGASF